MKKLLSRKWVGAACSLMLATTFAQAASAPPTLQSVSVLPSVKSCGPNGSGFTCAGSILVIDPVRNLRQSCNFNVTALYILVGVAPFYRYKVWWKSPTAGYCFTQLGLGIPHPNVFPNVFPMSPETLRPANSYNPQLYVVYGENAAVSVCASHAPPNDDRPAETVCWTIPNFGAF